MDVLIACEESQTICKAFRERGHNAFSCDIQPCSGGHPEWHICGDCLCVINGKCSFVTEDGKIHRQPKVWDLLVAHPPCTYMSKAGARWMYPTAGNINYNRLDKALKAKEFFFMMLNADCERIAVENPVPLKIVELPPPSCVVQPYEYGEPYSKKTMLWLKNLPPLVPTNVLTSWKTFLPSNTGGKKRGQKYGQGVAKKSQLRSKTFQGVAAAMAEQWGNLDNQIFNNSNENKRGNL